jgi:hypothetical protein
MITTISAIGRLGNDPEQKVSLKGAEYILFDLAVDPERKPTGTAASPSEAPGSVSSS